MNTSELKKFAQSARLQLLDQVGARLDRVLLADSAELREQAKAVQMLQDQITESSREAVIDRVAYIWFNRFCALRFMDVNRYSRVGTVSPAEGFSQPEILQDAKQGHVDEQLQVDSNRIFDLLSGKIPASDPQQEAYRSLLVAVCNHYHSLMPFMFERITDYTELLMPDDLLSENAILPAVREALTTENCGDIEVIGWLYQFYISEKKEAVFAGLKKNKKITPENIPAATQLFTPRWIVQYLVENSLGRLWMLNQPNSGLIERMPYYIPPEKQETDFLKVNSPEEIRICDPACGSGHMLVYAFDLLYGIYEEAGYDAKEIPGLILSKNLYGIEIDERAGELAAFALFMKAREKYHRFFQKPVKPNICVLKNIAFSQGELSGGVLPDTKDALQDKLLHDLHLFREVDNFGSLVVPELSIEQIEEIKTGLSNHWKHNTQNTPFDTPLQAQVITALQQAEYLSSRYHVVIANPPYMGGKGMNGELKSFAQNKFKDSKSDLFAMFIERNLDLVKHCGMVAMITMQSWMFLSSFEKLRTHLLDQKTILSMAHLGARAFDSIGGEVVSTTAFVLENQHDSEYKGAYIRLVDGKSEKEKSTMFMEALRGQ